MTSSAPPLVLSASELLGSNAAAPVGNLSKTKAKYFGFQAINLTWEGVSVESSEVCIVGGGLWIVGEDGDVLVRHK